MHILKIIVLQRHDYNCPVKDWNAPVWWSWSIHSSFRSHQAHVFGVRVFHVCSNNICLFLYDRMLFTEQHHVFVRNNLFCFFLFCHRPTLSHVQSVAISNRNTSCVASVMLRFAKKLLWFASKYSQWRVAHWELQPWKRLFYMRGRPQDKLTKTNGL